MHARAKKSKSNKLKLEFLFRKYTRTSGNVSVDYRDGYRISVGWQDTKFVQISLHESTFQETLLFHLSYLVLVIKTVDFTNTIGRYRFCIKRSVWKHKDADEKTIFVNRLRHTSAGKNNTSNQFKRTDNQSSLSSTPN